MPGRAKDALEQLHDEIRQLQNISAQQTEIASKQLEAYAIVERIMETLLNIIMQLAKLEEDRTKPTTQHHNNDPA
jgi:hypothetical protein